MDTEAFVQPAGRFDSSEEDIGDVIKNVVINMEGPTRFLSEGGGKWFINNMNYSGIPLWGEAPEGGQWVNMSRGEAHGLALDMTEKMSFLTDPHFHSEEIAKIKDPSEKKKTLQSVLEKTKPFLRLVDAYIISHEKGNQIYNEERGERSKRARSHPDSDDASYHWQIAVDAELLMKDPESKTLFKTGDLEIIEAMAKMKMKGKNPTPWDVLGEGPEALEKGLAMVARMETLSAEILANTAETYHQESMRIIQSGTPSERKEARADVNRRASHLRKTLEGASSGSLAMMTPKAKVDGNRVLVRNETSHRIEILDRMKAIRALRAAVEKGEDAVRNLIAEQPEKDPAGKKTSEDIGKIIRRIYDPDTLTRQLDETGIQLADEDTFTGWLQYNWVLSEQLNPNRSPR